MSFSSLDQRIPNQVDENVSTLFLLRSRGGAVSTFSGGAGAQVGAFQRPKVSDSDTGSVLSSDFKC